MGGWRGFEGFCGFEFRGVKKARICKTMQGIAKKQSSGHGGNIQEFCYAVAFHVIHLLAEETEERDPFIL